MTRIYLLRYPKDTSNQPIIYHLVQRYAVEFNILKADIRPQRDGIMVVELKGPKEKVADALDYLKSLGVKSERLAGKVHRDEKNASNAGPAPECARLALCISNDRPWTSSLNRKNVRPAASVWLAARSAP
ncbi:NIL domain-containing protein [Desulfobulbus sp. US5]|nr:NIL domain-containing protein [Desulfobulbus sp. US5]